MKILVFGSAFNPPHNGHLKLINEAVGLCAPDLALLIPTGNPPHKKIADCPQDSRLRMAQEIARLIDCRCEVLDYELRNRGPSYTINTIRHILKCYPNATINLLIGSDMLLYFSNWYCYTEIIKLCTIIVAVRDDIDRRKITSVIMAIKNLGGNAEFMPMEPFVVSSSEIRDTINSLGDCSKLVPKGVLNIIKKDKLYRPIHLRILAQKVKKLQSPKRYRHTLMVCKMAICLARVHQIPTYKVCAAALLHDVAKEFSHENILQLIKESGIIIECQELPSFVLHGYAGAQYAKQSLGVADEEILSAIRCHSTGKTGMTTLDKIIYLADMVGEDRSFKEVTELRKLAIDDLDAAMIKSLELSLFWLKRDNKRIAPQTKQALDELKGSRIEE